MPDFCLADYDRLLTDFLAAGYVLGPVEELPQRCVGPCAFLRHDIDLHIPGIERMAKVESALGVNATYYVPLTLHFNPFYPENQNILRKLVADGHRIGLHYDLKTYPWDRQAAQEHLDREIVILSALADTPVDSICMHFPWEGREDFLRTSGRYIHPHDPRYAKKLVYVSDSCRAWRDETLLRCFGKDRPQLLLLNTHPELWLGEPDTGRNEFARGTLLENTVRQHRAYVTDHMIPAWEAHPAPKRHDERKHGRSLTTERQMR